MAQNIFKAKFVPLNRLRAHFARNYPLNILVIEFSYSRIME